MLTPRHQALLATLAGMTVGVAVFGTVLAINDQTADSSATVVTTPSASTDAGPTDGLQAASLQFAMQNFGTEQAPVTCRGAGRLEEHRRLAPGPATSTRPASGSSGSTPAGASSRRTRWWRPGPTASTSRT